MAGNGGMDSKYGAVVWNVSFTDVMGDGTGTDVRQAMMVRVTEKGLMILAMRQVGEEAVPKTAMEGMKKVAGEGAVKYPRKIEYFVDEKLVKYAKPWVQYEAMLMMTDKTPRNIDVGEDGSLIELTSPAKEDETPKAVMDAVKKAVEGGEIKNLAKVERFVDDQQKTREKPKVCYKVMLKKEKKYASMVGGEDGTVLQEPTW